MNTPEAMHELSSYHPDFGFQTEVCTFIGYVLKKSELLLILCHSDLHFNLSYTPQFIMRVPVIGVDFSSQPINF